jgi:hypothetical protein
VRGAWCAALLLAACGGRTDDPAAASTSDPARPSPSARAAAGHDCVDQARSYADLAAAPARGCSAAADCGCAVTSVLASVRAPGLVVAAAATITRLGELERAFLASGCHRDFNMAAAACAPACVAGACAPTSSR